ncbi:uncharacterized protein DUF4350 [Rathayibacter sp. PhB93]|uniref:DUF4350 domain-containing protein n=1 Tax=unclassified Rathayibacter TaxID=2609250 RepID=UPI000F461E82|nr:MULTISPECIES: DUF4350 domain-containing protein [unclassified Rathayibacter]ROQ17902.1 uncharacterized protein DUF4350 [Rathayibacter sp. PhB93]TDQ13877.1 uncharacterized protein DUF4350 [Rathayibacter sp. PhB1]
MTAPAASTASDAPVDTVSSPTLGALLRRGRIWALLAAMVAVGTVLLTVATGSPVPAADLDVDSAAPDGARAVAQVLREQGIDVVRADSLDEALRAVGPGSTLLLDDPGSALDEEQYARLAEDPAAVVLVEPSGAALDALLPGVAFAGAPREDGVLAASCALPAAERAEGIPAGGSTFRVLEGGAVGCFPSGDDAFALVADSPAGGPDVVAVGDADLLRNGTVAEEGRAALALGLLGGEDRLVWYRAGTADATSAAVDPADLAPGWVTPALLLLVGVFVASAVWRGRRFGPLAVEPLPVVVHASETARGRARLYAHGATRVRALDALRIGTLHRSAALLGLAPSSGVDEVVAAAAALLERDPRAVRRLLVDDEPADDAALVAASDELLRFESALRAARAPRTGTTAAGTPGPGASGPGAAGPGTARPAHDRLDHDQPDHERPEGPLR